MLKTLQKIFKPIFSAFFSNPSASEKKDSNGDAPIFRAIASGNVGEVKRIIEEDRSVLEQTNENGYTPIFKAIFANNPEIVNMIIEKDPSVLKKTDPSQNTPIFIAIIQERQEIVRMIIKKDPSVLKQKHWLSSSPISYALELEKPKIAEMILEENPWVLKQMNSIDINSILNSAIDIGNLGIVKMIIKENPSVLSYIDENGHTALSLAALISCHSSHHDKATKSEVLQTILEHQFPGNIKEDTQRNLEELILKKSLLKGLYSKEDASSTFNALKNTFNKITQKNTFNKIYQDLFENVDKNQPIASKNDENMYIFSSKLKGHQSFFIFHVNKANELTSISYCDGNLFDEKQKIKDSATHINGVTTFHLKAPIEYSYEKFVKNFIEKNSENKTIEDFYEKFTKNAIDIEEADIDYTKTTHSIPTKAQKRGNCVFKSTSLVARVILEAIDPTMKFGFDMASQKPTGDGYDKYKKFKDNLAKKTLESMIEIKEDISSKSDPLSEYLKKVIEDVMKIAMEYNTKKLSNDDQLRTEFHKEMRDTLFPAQRNKDETPKASCFSFFASCFSSSKTPQR